MVSPTTLRLLGLVFVLALAAQIWSDPSASPPVEADPNEVAVSATAAPTSGGEDELSTETSAAATTTTAPLDEMRSLSLELITTEVTRPVALAAPVGDPRLFIVDRIGVIHVLDPSQGGSVSVFMDIRDRVTADGLEQGLLGLAFHPEYAENRRFYVYHVDTGGNRQIAEYQARADNPDRGDLDTERVLWERPQPGEENRHYGGSLQFGPDGYLWLSIGDGARASVNGQDPGNFYGTIQRLDVDSGDPYGIPADNPFVGGGGAPETWAFGVRNPWRIAVDPVDRLVYVADVGQAIWEEINVISIDTGAGTNFGWPITEGNSCFNANTCDKAGITLPVIEYGHDEGCSITGGLVYRGTAIPEIDGHYFYSDWCTGFVRSFVFVNGEVAERIDWSDQLPEAGQVNTFGVDGFGELYLANHADEVYKVVANR